MDLLSYTRPELILYPLPDDDRQTVLRAFAQRLQEQGVVADAERLLAKLIDRENLGSTGIGSGVAIPHCKLSNLEAPVLAIGLSRKPGVAFGAVDDRPVRLFFVLVSPEDNPAAHLQVLAAVSRWIKNQAPLERLLSCKRPESLYALLQEFAEPVAAAAEGS
jgi:mannitol/fructose-specific phosphotransferase system IIA component (Ntr-type)